MSGSRVVLDASALLALINQEPGSEKVAAVISTACMSSVNVAEVVSKLMDKGFSEVEIREIFEVLKVLIIPFDEEQSFISGLLRTNTKGLGLSLGDRACLSLAIQQKLSVLTADRVWAGLQVGLNIQMIR
ncbi:type II toxin-antitoxin system VapC family toxin [Altericista sp. CCNU0014]|uniref:type II toxin-antitoxin system VapC family toxin n=1 Tax=Altericista sp. CCNU0014 TaxID=3082949 RepID=UPI00384AFF3C